jgi:hypothetical protein
VCDRNRLHGVTGGFRSSRLSTVPSVWTHTSCAAPNREHPACRLYVERCAAVCRMYISLFKVEEYSRRALRACSSCLLLDPEDGNSMLLRNVSSSCRPDGAQNALYTSVMGQAVIYATGRKVAVSVPDEVTGFFFSICLILPAALGPGGRPSL